MSYKFKRKKIALIIGNGLTLDLLEHLKIKEEWNSSSPFSWKDKINKPESYQTKKIEEIFPRLNLVIQNFKNGKSDFEMLHHIFLNKNEVINFLVNNYSFDKNIKNNYDFVWGILKNEIEHYFSFAFSTFQKELENHNKNIVNWNYFKWIKQIKKTIRFIINFNYDLVIEDTLDYNSISYFKFINTKEKDCIPILKPHGSVDYEVSDTAIIISKKYPLENVFLQNNTPLSIIKRKDLFKPRKIPQYVLPSEYSKISDFQWIKPEYNAFKNISNKLDIIYFIGISYSKYDKNEIFKNIINCIHPKTKVIIVNPNPNKNLINSLKKQTTKVFVAKNSINLLGNSFYKL